MYYINLFLTLLPLLVDKAASVERDR